MIESVIIIPWINSQKVKLPLRVMGTLVVPNVFKPVLLWRRLFLYPIWGEVVAWAMKKT